MVSLSGYLKADTLVGPDGNQVQSCIELPPPLMAVSLPIAKPRSFGILQIVGTAIGNMKNVDARRIPARELDRQPMASSSGWAATSRIGLRSSGQCGVSPNHARAEIRQIHPRSAAGWYGEAGCREDSGVKQKVTVTLKGSNSFICRSNHASAPGRWLSAQLRPVRSNFTPRSLTIAQHRPADDLRSGTTGKFPSRAHSAKSRRRQA